MEPRTITNLARVPSVLQACVRPPRISGGAQDDSREEDASKWEAEDVEAWLQELGLSQYQVSLGSVSLAECVTDCVNDCA